MNDEEEDQRDRMLFDLGGKKLMQARQTIGGLTGADTNAIRLMLDALDNLYALLQHRLMGEETKL